jgi:signal transduction histidine kinase
MLWRRMPSERSALLSTLLSLPDESRPAVERALLPLARSAALGDLAADVAHDLANPLLGVLGLAELLLDDATPGTEEEERLRLLHLTAVELKGNLRALLDFARPADDVRAEADLAAAARRALAFVRKGAGKTLEVDERYPEEPQLVACPEPLAVQAALHVLLAARAAGPAIAIAVADGALRVAPAGPESLGLVAAARIAADHAGSLERSGDALTLRLPLRESRET